MNTSLTLAFLIAAGIGTVVQNTLMVRITQTSSTILIAMLLNSLVGIVLFVTLLWFRQGMAGFGELASSVRWWTLILACWVRFRVCQHQRLSACGGGDHDCRAGRQSAYRRTGAGPPAQPRGTAEGADWSGLWRGDAGGGRMAGGKTIVLTTALPPSGPSQDRAAFCQLLAARFGVFFMLLLP